MIYDKTKIPYKDIKYISIIHVADDYHEFSDTLEDLQGLFGKRVKLKEIDIDDDWGYYYAVSYVGNIDDEETKNLIVNTRKEIEEQEDS